MISGLAVHTLTAVLFGAGLLTLASCLYLMTLALASFLHRPVDAARTAHGRILVLIPAHNEEATIGRCLASIARQTYPRRRRQVVVIADNCIDRTADVARSHGAQVIIRSDPAAPGKGRALRWALDQLLARRRSVDVIVMIDADSVAEPDALRHLEADLAAGAEVAQADYRILDPETSPGARLVAAGFLLFHRTRLTGRAALGLPANLVGNGMAFKREVLERVPWRAFTSVEDLEYSLQLRLAGVRPVFSSRAIVMGPVPRSRRALRRQRMRWEGGRFFMLRTWIGPLLATFIRRRDWGLLDAALDLAILPTGLLVLAVGFGFCLAGLAVLAGLMPVLPALPWALSLILLPMYVTIGLKSAGAPPSTYRALLLVPGYLARKVFVYARLAGGFDPDRWEVAARGVDSDHLFDPDGDGKAWIGGIPVDVVDMAGAVTRVMGLVGRPDGGQVCTVNLDFVVSAQKDPEVSAVLKGSDLNLADGAPVTWLARIVGHRLPRVPGADLVPLIAAASAERGVPVFFLGGEASAAEESARRLSTSYPSLRVAGCYEPPRAEVHQLPSDEMVRLIRQSGAGIVLVGLGHPKQERWIAQNRTQLGSSVAIGVGGCFDFITGRRRRAPRWLQACGLEWLFRLLQEPRRLSARYLRDAGWLIVLTARALKSRRRLAEQLRSAEA